MEDKTTLAQKDIRFARTIQRLQRVVIAELEKLCVVHLFSLGFRDKDLLSFKLSLNNPSKLAELQELEHLRTKFDIAGSATDGYFSKRWVYKNIFKLSEEEIQRMQIEQFSDAKLSSIIEQTGEAAAGGEGGGEGGLDDLLGDEGGDDAGDDLLGDTGDEGDEDEGPLLAQPGDEPDEPAQRDDGYTPVTSTKFKQGARKRSYLSSVGNNIASSSERNLFKGWSGEMGPLSRGIVGEALDKEEKLLHETQHEVKQLIEQLERKNEKET